MRHNKNKEEKTISQLEFIPGSRHIILPCIGFAFALLVIGLLLYLSSGSIDKAHGFSDQSAVSSSLSGKPEHQNKNAKQNPLPNPSSLLLQQYEKKLYAFIQNREYDTKLNWCVDKGVRDTGPWIQGKYYGTHPAVRIYYSPRVMYWLTGNPDFWPEGKKSGKAKPKKPREGPVPDGGMIVKEMFQAPAKRYESLTEQQIVKTLYESSAPGWTVMVKDSRGSKDGWFWSSVYVNEPIDSPESLNYPDSGFGQPCLRCHASAQKESTYSALSNINGFPGDPVTFFVDDTWRDLPPGEYPRPYEHSDKDEDSPVSSPSQLVSPNPEFLETFGTMGNVPFARVLNFPSESNDHVVSGPKGPGAFLTSDICMMCHSGASSYGMFGPIMFLESGPNYETGLNVSPYGEWRWSPMGLAGRDPIFHAQLESEISILEKELANDKEKAKFYSQQTVNTCLLCHGAMGKRQYDIDQEVGNEYWSPKANFKLDWYYIIDPLNPHFKYGGLGRDGISCTVCHHIEGEYKGIKLFLENSITGQFKQGKPTELFGPFANNIIATFPMEDSLGIKPLYNSYVKSSRLCGSCHTIDLPVVDYPLKAPPKVSCEEKPDLELNKPDKNPNFKPFMHKIEQATYLEWLNSKFQDEFNPNNKDAKSCQDCHMPGGYHNLDRSIDIKQLKTKIAVVEDQDYPEADNRAKLEEINVRFQEEGFSRHKLQGLNVFMAEIFTQFNDILGVRLQDYESGAYGLRFAIDNFVQNARKNTATLEITDFRVTNQEVIAEVTVTNLTGHRFPSGVGFRRAFIEFLVLLHSDNRQRVVWSSGLTNGVGVIVDNDGQVLPSEFLTKYRKDGKTLQHYQPHWQTIDSSDKVQIYEELTRDARGEFTTSFIHRDCEIKDNRLLPMGWTAKGPSASIPKAFIEATHPGPLARKDPRYKDGSGTDVVIYRVKLPKGVNPKDVSVRAALYSQSWAPYYLYQRFTDVPDGPEGAARRRLYYLTSHLNVKGTHIEDWKLRLVSDSAPKKGI